MKPLDKGTFYYLPVLQRSLNKTTELIKRFMHKVDGQQITIPNLTSVDLWSKSGQWSKDTPRKMMKVHIKYSFAHLKLKGRLENYQSELFVTNDRHGQSLLLGPVIIKYIKHMYFKRMNYNNIFFVYNATRRLSKRQLPNWWQ